MQWQRLSDNTAMALITSGIWLGRLIREWNYPVDTVYLLGGSRYRMRLRLLRVTAR